MASKYISQHTELRPPSASLSSVDLSLQVHLQTHPSMASKNIIKARLLLYGDTGLTEVVRVMGSIYLTDHREDRHHCVFVSSYHTTKIYTLLFPTFGLSHSVRDLRDLHNCVNPQGQVVSYLLTLFLSSFSQNCSVC